jgi:hypothetical protein
MHARKKSIVLLLILVAVSIAIAVIVAAYLGVFDDRDSFFYAVLGEFLYFKNNIPMRPFINDPPQTLFGPVYALLVLPLSYIPAPGAMIAITAVQILMLFASAGIVGYLAGWPAALLLVLFPFSISFTTVMMSEITTMFLVSVYTVVLYGWTVKHWKFANPSTLLLIAGVLVLTRYAFIPLFVISFGLFFFLPVKNPPPFRLAGTVGVLMVFAWILFNIHLHGIIALSTVTGRHLYNNVVSTAHIMPPYPDPKTNYFMDRFINKNRIDMLIYPWWDNEMLFNDGILPQTLIDQMYMDVALVTVRHHPFQYAANAIREFFVIPITAPLYPDSAITYLRECPATSCHFTWNRYLCTPTIDNCSVRGLFASLFEWEKTLYPFPMIVFLILAVLGIIAATVRGPLFMRLIAGIFVMQHLFQSGTEWVEGRFLVPLYPLYILLILYGAKTIVKDIPQFLYAAKKKRPRNK